MALAFPIVFVMQEMHPYDVKSMPQHKGSFIILLKTLIAGERQTDAKTSLEKLRNQVGNRRNK